MYQILVSVSSQSLNDFVTNLLARQCAIVNVYKEQRLILTAWKYQTKKVAYRANMYTSGNGFTRLCGALYPHPSMISRIEKYALRGFRFHQTHIQKKNK